MGIVHPSVTLGMGFHWKPNTTRRTENYKDQLKIGLDTDYTLSSVQIYKGKHNSD